VCAKPDSISTITAVMWMEFLFCGLEVKFAFFSRPVEALIFFTR